MRSEEIAEQFLKENDWVRSEDGRYLYMSYNGSHTFDAIPILGDVIEYASQFREPSTQGGERHKKEVDDAWIAGVMSERSAAKDEIERLKQENERMKDKIKQYEKPKKQCPKCGSDNVVMFTPDLDLCRNCDNQFI